MSNLRTVFVRKRLTPLHDTPKTQKTQIKYNFA